MKLIFSILFVTFCVATYSQFNRNKVFNKDLKHLAGKWAGTMVYTDFNKNNAQVTLRVKLNVADLRDTLLLGFEFTEPDKTKRYDSSSIFIDDVSEILHIGGEAFKIVSTARRGPRLTVVGEQYYGSDNNRVADHRYTIVFGTTSISVKHEVRYVENEYFFIRSRANYSRK